VKTGGVCEKGRSYGRRVERTLLSAASDVESRPPAAPEKLKFTTAPKPEACVKTGGVCEEGRSYGRRVERTLLSAASDVESRPPPPRKN
jgi:hypothetical protein